MKEDENKEEEGLLISLDVIYGDERYTGNAKVFKDKRVEFLFSFNEGRRLTYDGEPVVTVGEALTSQALKQAAFSTEDITYMQDLACCVYTGYLVHKDLLIRTHSGDYVFPAFTREYEGTRYRRNEGATHSLRRHNGDIDHFWAPDSFWNGRYFCDDCQCYLEDSDDYSGGDLCIFCRKNHVIEEYCESHKHNDDPVYFGEYTGEFAGLGFELEVDCDSDQSNYNNDVARDLCSACGLEENEMRYAHDGSLNYGFECISEPHTVKDFWDKADKWRAMLKYLSNHGYASHDPGTCGLHIHVSRSMFGKTKAMQDLAIAKVYTFFDENWQDIVRISRRTADGLGYCEKNRYCYEHRLGSDTAKQKLRKWRKDAKYQGGHGVALNNSNSHTFEYRLGRGTLNAWSFFSWIDFVLTVTKNAKRIAISKVEANDLVSWLAGVRESTAKYIYKRGAFRTQMLTLYPNIEWETDLTDC